MAAPIYDVLLVCHLAAGLIGFGAVGVAGWAAADGARSKEPTSDERLLRFFKLGPDWPARLVLVVPVFGLAMLFGGDSRAVSSVWPWAGLALWTVAAGHLLGLAWPNEKRAQHALGASSRGEARGDDFRLACKKMERASAVAIVCFVLALALMIWQP